VQKNEREHTLTVFHLPWSFDHLLYYTSLVKHPYRVQDDE
jgi:hypothetical protein